LVNGTSASGLGAEIAVDSQPFRDLTLGLSVGWNDLAEDADVVDAAGTLLFAKGDRLSNSPKYTGGASIDYAFPLAGTWKGHVSGSVNYTSPLNTVNASTPIRPSQAITMARLGFSVESASWRADAFVDNVNNEHGFTRWDPVDPPGARERVRPRTYGLQVEYRF
jgi:hypothetical protein